MKKFLIHSAIFFIINIFIFTFFIFLGKFVITDKSDRIKESIILSLPQKMQFDFVILGTSHVLLFSSDNNYNNIKKITNSTFFNLGKTNGAGVIPEKIFLRRFYMENNTTDKVVYFIDPWVLYSAKWNEENPFPLSEPFDISFLADMFNSKIKFKIILGYFKSKVEPSWFFPSVVSAKSSKTVQLLENDKHAIKERLKVLYPTGVNHLTFLNYKQHLNELIEMARKNNSKVTFIVPPTLLGQLPGNDELMYLLDCYKKEGVANYFDYSNSVLNLNFYQDHDHLNDAGVEYFFKNYFKSALTENFDYLKEGLINC